MPAHQPASGALLAFAFLTIGVNSIPGQTAAKTKPKPGAAFTVDSNDLPKAGAALSPWAVVQRPAPLKNVRSWSIETKRHRWIATHMAVRPDGRQLATCGYDGLVRIWDTETGAFERALVGHEGAVAGLAWSPDGNYLASAGYYSARIWDVKSGLPVRVLRGKYGIALVAWSPDGNRLLTGGGGSGQLALWDVTAGKQLAEIEYGQPIASIAFSPTGEYVAVAAGRAGTTIADSTRLKTVHNIKETADPDYVVAFSPDGKRLAAGNAKATVIYDVATGGPGQKLTTPGLALVWTPKGGLLVSGTGSQITPFEPANLNAGKPLPGAGAALSLSADGSALFGLSGGQVTHWDIDKGSIVRTFPVAEYVTLACGPAAVVLVQATTPTLWDPIGGKRIGALDGHNGAITALCWTPNGKALAVAAADNKVRVYEPATAKPLRTLTAPGYVSGLALAADGRIVCVTADKKVIIWAATGVESRHALIGHKDPPRGLAWTRDGRLLATGDKKDIFIWSAETGKQIKALEHPRDVYSLTWSNDGTRLIVGSSEDVALTAYQASTWKLLPALDKGTSLSVVATVWSADGLVLLGHRNSAVQQWNAKTGHLGAAVGSPGPATTPAFWPDGKTIAAGCVDRAARLWDSATGRLRLTAIADRDEVIAVVADGHYRCPESAEDELVAVVLTDKSQETLSLKEFAAKYGFRNAPANVK